MPMMEHTYATYEDCFKSLTRMNANPDEIVECLDHEKQHFDKAKELGYQPVYGVKMVPEFPPIIDFYFIDFKDKKPVGQDMIDILLAPDQPGENDLKLVDRIRSEMR